MERSPLSETTLSEAREARLDRLLDVRIDEQIGILFSAKDVGPEQRHQLRGLLKHYAKKARPFTSCVRDNMKRFGPGRTEAVCATLKDIIRGTTKWRGNPEGDRGSAGLAMSGEPFEISEELVELLMSIDEERLQLFFSQCEEAIQEEIHV